MTKDMSTEPDKNVQDENSDNPDYEVMRIIWGEDDDKYDDIHLEKGTIARMQVLADKEGVTLDKIVEMALLQVDSSTSNALSDTKESADNTELTK